MGQHVQSLPVTFDLSGDVLILQDHALSSTLTPFCNRKEKTKWKDQDIANHIHKNNTYYTKYDFKFLLLFVSSAKENLFFAPFLSRYLKILPCCVVQDTIDFGGN